jgi:hypothetical protein
MENIYISQVYLHLSVWLNIYLKLFSFFMRNKKKTGNYSETCFGGTYCLKNLNWVFRKSVFAKFLFLRSFCELKKIKNSEKAKLIIKRTGISDISEIFGSF